MSFYDLSMPAVMWGYRQHKQYMKNAIGWLFYLPHHQSGGAEIYRSWWLFNCGVSEWYAPGLSKGVVHINPVKFFFVRLRGWAPPLPRCLGDPPGPCNQIWWCKIMGIFTRSYIHAHRQTTCVIKFIIWVRGNQEWFAKKGQCSDLIRLGILVHFVRKNYFPFFDEDGKKISVERRTLV